MNIDKNVIGIIDAIKRDILSTRNRIFENANRELISMYYRIGQIISENSKYGNQFVETLSSALKLDFPDATGYSVRNLFRMKKFYEEYKDFPILPPSVAELPWTHNCILIEKEKVKEKRLWYAEKTLEKSRQCTRGGCFLRSESLFAYRRGNQQTCRNKSIGGYGIE